MTRTAGPAVVRLATVGDVEAVAQLERRAFSDPWSRSAFATLLGRPHVLFAVAVDETDSLLGYVVAWYAADEAEIANVAVEPEARGRGLGAVLLDFALAEAVRRGAAAVFLEVRESNAPARRLYASRGFASVGRRRGYYKKPLEDALVLRRELDQTSDDTREQPEDSAARHAQSK